MGIPKERFKRELAEALPLWISEGLLEPAQARKLAEFYQFDRADAVVAEKFSGTMHLLGGVVAALGLLAFVAANWVAISPVWRVVGGLLLMFGANLLGRHWWQSPEPGVRNRGTGLLAFGSILLAGNLALIAQWLQIGDVTWQIFLGWGLGTAAMAYALRHVTLALIAALAFVGLLGCPNEWLFLLPCAYGLVVLPLAYALNSRSVVALAWVGLIGGMLAIVADQDAVMIGLVTALLGLALYGWSLWHEQRLPWISLQKALVQPFDDGGDDAMGEMQNARYLALSMGFLLPLQCLAFQGMCVGWFGVAMLAWPTIVTVIVFACCALALWVRTAAFAPLRALHWATLGAVACLALAGIAGAVGYADPFADGVSLDPGSSSSVGLMVTLLLNAALSAVSIGILWLGLRLADRYWFWMGMASLSFQLITRFFEVESGLLIKALAFLAWGGVLVCLAIRNEPLPLRRPLPLPCEGGFR